MRIPACAPEAYRTFAGQAGCRIGYEITIGGSPVGRALDRDHRGRQIPEWQGCCVLEENDVFLMNSHPSSLDAREAERKLGWNTISGYNWAGTCLKGFAGGFLVRSR